MANLLKIARGDKNYVTGFFEGTGLTDGQLFWQATHKETDSLVPWDEGTLYIGRPDNKASAPIAIAGPRAVKSLVFRGPITGSTHLDNDIFKHASTGDFWVYTSNVADSADPDVLLKEYDFRKGDMLLIVDSTIDPKTGIATNLTILRINNSGGSASDTYFDPAGTDFDAKFVSDALKELEVEKLSYRGVLFSQTDAALVLPHIGTMYLIGADGITVPTWDSTKTSTVTLTGPGGRALKKGDFIYHLKDSLNGTALWYLIPSGYTDANDIDFHISAEVTSGMNPTFLEDHLTAILNVKDVQAALKLLFQSKAQIGSDGKVPLSQLPDTVLGALQYKGAWNPLLESTYDSAVLALHYNEHGYQTSWPTSPSDGDYWIVQTVNTYQNIQYSDKSSVLSNGQYSRTLELNNGDWIVWSNSPVDSDSSQGHWEKIDNSDRISVINFGINAVNTGSIDPHTVDEYTVGRVGSPKLRADHKIALYEHADGSIVVAGLRLVDQSREDNAGVGKSNFIPRYTQYQDSVNASNTLENSNIEDTRATGTVIHHNFQVGTALATKTEIVYGDVKILPDTILENGASTRTRNGLMLATPQDPMADNTLNWLTRLLSAANVSADISVTLPELDSVIIGKRPQVALIPRRLTKSIKDGYIMSTSIEEHTTTDAVGVDTDEVATIVEIHAPILNVENAGLRHLVFGNRAELGTGFEDDGSLVDEFLTHVYAHSNITSNITLILPERSGILLTNIDWQEFVNGTKDTLPLFGDVGTDGKRKIIDSQIRQVTGSLLATMKLAVGNEIDDTGTTDATFADEFVPVKTDPDVEIDQDVLIGKLDKITGALTKRGLQVTKFLGLGNDETSNTFLVPGRKMFPNSLQYRDPFTYKKLPEETVYAEMPSASGVLLTDNSVIDGGIYGFDVEELTASLSTGG